VPLSASDAPEDHRQNDLVVLNRELAAAILAGDTVASDAGKLNLRKRTG
jgi:hypothetical protein